MNRPLMENMIRNHEGCEYVSYHDTQGKRTVAIGFNLDRQGAQTRIEALKLDYQQVYDGACTLTDKHCSALFTVDLDDAIFDARNTVHNFDSQPDDVQAVIVDMIFNLGAAGFAKFKNTIAAFERNDYCTAAAEMADSLWAGQVPHRAEEDIEMVRSHCV